MIHLIETYKDLENLIKKLSTAKDDNYNIIKFTFKNNSDERNLIIIKGKSKNKDKYTFDFKQDIYTIYGNSNLKTGLYEKIKKYLLENGFKDKNEKKKKIINEKIKLEIKENEILSGEDLAIEIFKNGKILTNIKDVKSLTEYLSTKKNLINKDNYKYFKNYLPKEEGDFLSKIIGGKELEELYPEYYKERKIKIKLSNELWNYVKSKSEIFRELEHDEFAGRLEFYPYDKNEIKELVNKYDFLTKGFCDGSRDTGSVTFRSKDDFIIFFDSYTDYWSTLQDNFPQKFHPKESLNFDLFEFIEKNKDKLNTIYEIDEKYEKIEEEIDNIKNKYNYSIYNNLIKQIEKIEKKIELNEKKKKLKIDTIKNKNIIK